MAIILWSSYVMMTHKIYMVNMNSLASMSMNLIKPFLPQMVLDQISIHSASDLSWQDKLFETVDKSGVPEEYGGLADWNPLDLELINNHS
jgi:hypothetical protein